MSRFFHDEDVPKKVGGKKRVDLLKAIEGRRHCYLLKIGRCRSRGSSVRNLQAASCIFKSRALAECEKVC